MTPHTPFTAMAKALAKRYPAAPAPATTCSAPGQTLTARIRELVRQHGPLSSLSIAATLEIDGSSGLVYALLKNDLQKGQVEFSDGKFYWNHDYDAGLAKRISQAAALLKRHGYRVKAPETV